MVDSAAELRRLRATAHGIGAESTVAAVGQRMLAIQAQDFAAAQWAIGLRSGRTREEVLDAFSRGDLVRAWTMRGTLFAVPAGDLSWLLSLTAGRMLAQAARRREQLGLDDRVIESAREIAVGALSGGGEVSRDEFMSLLNESGIDPRAGRGYHVIAHLAQTGTWCWGPVRDGMQRLVLCSEWIRAARALEPDEALGEYLVRYLGGHGPAALRDFVGWSKLSLGEARRARAVAGDRILAYGDDLLMNADADATPGTAQRRRRFAASVQLLPGFDEFYLGYTDRSPIIDTADENLVVPGGNGVFQPTVMRGGRVLALWRRAVVKKGVRVEVTPFASAPASLADSPALRRASREYARFLGQPLVA
ncbi:winged helix DNA-binding domain-containing protein [Rathayibacter sp. YIM 133350]|uniref:winged helix DNA-binding domain-containing protein n=1 Tax=Rathayibacter sp. YIM 133350 TaxID=3131992 RepID=UPI00307E1621